MLKHTIKLILAIALGFPLCFSLYISLFISTANAEPVKVIFDTDMGNDVDDALALAMLHSLQNRGESELLAITISKDHPEVPSYIDAINTFYGRGQIPIGITNSGVTPEQSLFTGIAQEIVEDRFVFPHDLKISDSVPQALALLRETLSLQADQSVVIIQVGFSTNLALLLATKADSYSDLTGRELVAEKVKVISIMAGAFAAISGNTHLEYNVVNDISSAQTLAEQWPTPIIWSGFEIGLAIRYPAASIENDFGYIERHPIPESYQLYNPTPHQRPSWDLTSIVWAIRSDRDYFDLSEAGKVTVLSDGETIFSADPDGLHYYLQLDQTAIPRIQELMTLLVSEPPLKASD